MSVIVKTVDLGKLVLNETDPVKSVMQNIGIIIRTRMETVPLYRQFGCRYDFLDRPVTVASPAIVADLKEAIEEFEPRVRVRAIRFTLHPDRPGTLSPEVEVDIIEQES